MSDFKQPKHASSRHRQARRRGGFTLVYMAMLLVAFLAIMSLVIDMGFLMLARRQMQAAVSTAACEGLRFRDGIPQAWQLTDDTPQALIEAYSEAGYELPSLPYDSSNALWQQYTDFARRWAAADLAGQTLCAPDRRQVLLKTIKVNVTPDTVAALPQYLQTIDPASPYDGYPSDPTLQSVLQPNMAQHCRWRSCARQLYRRRYPARGEPWHGRDLVCSYRLQPSRRRRRLPGADEENQRGLHRRRSKQHFGRPDDAAFHGHGRDEFVGGRLGASVHSRHGYC